VPHVEAILGQELAEFAEYLRSLDVLPLIAGIHQHAEAIRQAELEKTLRRLPDLSGAEIERIEAMTQALVRKLLEAPTHRLREEASRTKGPEYATVARRLFGLENHEDRADLATAAD
jgi:glutamyl-tRNA reductase